MSRAASPEFAAGMGLALAELHRLRGDSSGVCEVAKAAGLGLTELRTAGVDEYDLVELTRAGVPNDWLGEWVPTVPPP